MMRLSPIRYGVKAPPNTDPYSAYVINLLHFDGANNSTTFTDETGKVWVPQNSAKLVTDQQKFGTASMFCPGGISGAPSIACNNAYYTTPSIGTQDFCAEIFAWIDPAWTSIANRAIFGFNSTLYKFTVSHQYDFGGANGKFAGVIGSGAKQIVGNTTLPNKGQWYHLALTRSGNTLRFFVDGVLQGSSDVTGVSVGAETSLFIGEVDISTNYYSFFGRLDEFRLTVGVPRYTADFTPPSEAFVYP